MGWATARCSVVFVGDQNESTVPGVAGVVSCVGARHSDGAGGASGRTSESGCPDARSAVFQNIVHTYIHACPLL